jgi:hypothetical protein
MVARRVGGARRKKREMTESTATHGGGARPRAGNDEPERSIDVSIFGGRKLIGHWRPAKRMTSISILGGSHIDLSEAAIAEGGTTITRFALIGGTHVIVPDGVGVRVTGLSVFGGRRVDTGAESGTQESRLVLLRVFSLVGGVKVESRKGQ